ncbi:MAG: hypothetical protein WCI63_03705 [bacterium]
MEQKNKIIEYKLIVKGLGQALAVSKLYSFDHPVVKNKTKEVYGEVRKYIATKGKLVFSESPEATLLINGEELISVDSLTARFMQAFRNLKIGSIELLPGVKLDEFYAFIDLLINVDKLQEEGSIKGFLKTKKVTHIIPSFASYKLVNEHETITKKGDVIRADELSPDMIKKFTTDLTAGSIDKKIKAGNKIYQILAHDSEALSQVISENVKPEEQSDQITEILCLIGDYLVDEVNTAKQKEINIRVLNELKDKLLILYEEKKIKIPPLEEVDKTFATINAALQIKGLIALYAKNRQEQAVLYEKLKRAIKDLPTESRLYQKAKEDWDRIDHSRIDTALF